MYGLDFFAGAYEMRLQSFSTALAQLLLVFRYTVLHPVLHSLPLCSTVPRHHIVVPQHCTAAVCHSSSTVLQHCTACTVLRLCAPSTVPQHFTHEEVMGATVLRTVNAVP